MKKSKIFGYRSHTIWKMILATIYYLVCIILIIKGIFTKPLVGEVPSYFIGLSLLLPALMTSNFKIKRFIPILRHRRGISDLFGFLDFLLLFLILSVIFFTIPKEEKIVEDQEFKQEEVVSYSEYDDLIVHFIDVNEGDSTFIELPNNETILIDAGEKKYGDTVSNYISKLGYEGITYLIGTHPHSDHIGGLITIIDKFDIENIYMPKVVSNSNIYKQLLLNIQEHNLSVKSAQKGLKIIDTDELDVYFLSPSDNKYENLNNYSAVLKIDYKDESFLFMGDAETSVENAIKKECFSSVIKVGHHGSDTSSSLSFVNNVKPNYAIISVGADNNYNFPVPSIIRRWKNVGATIYRTDENGNIIISTDGNSLKVVTSK
ncbi:MAG: ComEC/Rec2 family competence protein [Bacilli bacterium]